MAVARTALWAQGNIRNSKARVLLFWSKRQERAGMAQRGRCLHEPNSASPTIHGSRPEISAKILRRPKPSSPRSAVAAIDSEPSIFSHTFAALIYFFLSSALLSMTCPETTTQALRPSATATASQTRPAYGSSRRTSMPTPSHSTRMRRKPASCLPQVSMLRMPT